MLWTFGEIINCLHAIPLLVVNRFLGYAEDRLPVLYMQKEQYVEGTHITFIIACNVPLRAIACQEQQNLERFDCVDKDSIL